MATGYGARDVAALNGEEENPDEPTARKGNRTLGRRPQKKQA